MATAATPQDVLDAVGLARAALASLLSVGGPGGSLEAWADVLGALQGLVNEASAVQDEVVVALAALDAERAEDGTVVEVRKAPGHVALDAPAIVSGVLCLSANQAERRVRDAVRRTADGPDGTATCTDHRHVPLPRGLPNPDLEPPPTTRPSQVVPDGPHSDLEHLLEAQLGGPHGRRAATCRVDVRHPSRPVDLGPVPHPRRWRAGSPWPDTPPF